MIVKFKKLHQDAVIPSRKRESDAGLDFHAIENLVVEPNETVCLKTGIAWEVDNVPEEHNVYMQIKARSGMAFKHHIECTSAGVIDLEYRGEIGLKIFNMGNESYQIREGDRVAQGIVKLLPRFTVEETVEISESTRGDSGFGDSGR